MAAECPSSDRLQALLKDEASPESTAAMVSHLEQCPACQKRMEEMAGGNADLPRLDPTATQPQSQLLVRLMRQLKDSDPDQLSQAESDALLSPGTTLRYFGDYEILGELGRGGMGVVYRARQISLNRVVALKLIVAGQLASPTEVRRFRTEAEAAARLDHPNIVPIYEIGEHEQRHYFSMKLVEGRSFSDRMSEVRSRKSHLEIALLVAQIARAVHYAHQRGVLHRDLKPGNILLDAQGEPHLTDFGLAKLLETDSGLTHSQAILGTPNYLAPEVAAGKAKEVTTATDVYSLGAVLYESLSGKPPFAEANVVATLQKVMNAEPPSLRTQNLSVPRDLETICLKCLAKEPLRRYGTALELAEDLERFTRHEPIAARPVGVPEKVWRWCRRKPALAASLAALHLVFVLGLAGVLWNGHRAGLEATHAKAEWSRAEAALLRAEFERIELILAEGRTESALPMLAQLVRRHPEEPALATRLASVLRQRNFCLPATTPLAHDAKINSVKFSPDGTKLVTASKDKTARLWDSQTGQLLFKWQHQADVRSAEFSPDGRLVVTASRDRTARIWVVATGLPHLPPLRHSNQLAVARFSPDGKSVATGTESACRLWDSQTGESLMPACQQYRIVSLHFSPDGQHLVASSSNGLVKVWDVPSGVLAGPPMTNVWGVKDARFTPDGTQLFVGHGIFFNWRTGEKQRQQINLGSYLITSTEFSSDGNRMIAAFSNGYVRIWELGTLNLLAEFLWHDSLVHYAEFSRDGKSVVTAGRDGSVRLWNSTTGEPLAEPLRHDAEVLAARFSPDGSRLVTLPQGTNAWLWKLRFDQPAVRQFAHGGSMTFARFSQDGRRLLTTSTDRTARLWDVETGQMLIPPLKHNGSVRMAAFSPDEQMILTVSFDKTARLWAATSGVLVREFSGYGDGLPTGEFSPEGRNILVVSGDGVAEVWDALSGKRLTTIRHGTGIYGARFSPDGKLFTTTSNDGTARVWMTETGEPVSPPLRHADRVLNAVFTPDGRRVVTVSDDKTARVWDARTGRSLLPPMQHGAALVRTSPDITADSQWLLTAAGNSARVWSLATGLPHGPALTHRQLVTSARFSRDGRRVVTASADHSVRVWDVRTGWPVTEPLKHNRAVNYADFSPDGSRIVSVGDDGFARVWDLAEPAQTAPDFLPAIAEAIAGRRITDENLIEPVSMMSLLQLKQLVLDLPDTAASAHWKKWFLAEDTNQPTPASP